jgi:membrane fusion protein, heavy metal efflux system
MAGAAALVVAIIALAAWLIERLIAARVPTHTTEPVPANTFRATTAQLAGLQLMPVTLARFRTELVAEGKISVNADATTPVYSPYSGRVVQLLAGIGESAHRGTPPLAIEASEYAQAVNDLHTVGVQLQLTQQVEKRRQAAYSAKGASLQDWQQAQADLAAAQSNLAAVRSRLHIFGLTDRDIDALPDAVPGRGLTHVVAPIDGVVTDRQVGPGQFLSAGGATPDYTIADLRTVWVIAYVREADALQLQRGQLIEVQVLAQPDRVYTSHIESVGAKV